MLERLGPVADLRVTLVVSRYDDCGRHGDDAPYDITPASRSDANKIADGKIRHSNLQDWIKERESN
ncbi:MAG TPA: hypothetical protein VGX91_00935 [Candidatus Cybelea sp.]|jgi:hypothetical protein|nr:hypothetical protein [Candidatus Cybelea sp.]